MMSVALATLDIGSALAHNEGMLKLWQKEMNAMYFTVKMTNFLNRVSGSKPTIDRMNVRTYNRMGKYYVGASANGKFMQVNDCLLYTSPSPRDGLLSRMPSSA